MWEEFSALEVSEPYEQKDFQENGDFAGSDVLLYGHEDLKVGAMMQPEYRMDVPGCEAAWVTGNPHRSAEAMDYAQGDNPYQAYGNCVLVSISNLLRRTGMDVTENDITQYAIENGICGYDIWNPPEENGAMTSEGAVDILAHYGIESDFYDSSEMDLETLADAVDCGKGTLIFVNSGNLWGVDDGSTFLFGKPEANHCITLTGIARDAYSGEIAGVYIADSGRWEPGDVCRYLTKEEFDEVYTNVWGSGACITRESVVEV